MTKPQRGKTPKKPPRKEIKQTDPVEVYSRIRPVASNVETCCKVISTTTLQLSPPESSNAVKNGNFKETRYTFQYVFDEYTSQKSLFDHVALPLVEDVLKGKNALLFAYGVTSSGKTHTMTGQPHDQGLLPRCLDVLFNSIGELQARKYVFKPDKMNNFDVQTEADAMIERQRREILPKLSSYTPRTPGTPRGMDRYDPSKMPRIRDPSVVQDVEEDNNYTVFVSYVEIYNNYIYDLLEELAYDPITGYSRETRGSETPRNIHGRPPQSKILREDSAHNMYVSGVVEVEVKSTEEAYEILWKGQKRRKVAETVLNNESSRSHSVFNIRLVQAPLDPVGEEVLQDKDKVVISQLSLVDLAGSERTGRTNSAGDRLREAGNINHSLMVLRTCIETLRENQRSGGNKMVPYRDSKLTHLFKNYFDGEGKVRMIVCVNPRSDEYDETIRVMHFAEMTQEVQVARPQQVRFDLGLTKGRRRMNKESKEAVANVVISGSYPGDVPVPSPLTYSMGPSFPPFIVRDPDDDVTLVNLSEFLQQREMRRTTLLTDLSNKHEQFRAQLLEMERENGNLKRKLADMENEVKSRDSELSRANKRLRSLEKSKDMLQKTTNVQEQERRDLERELSNFEFKINQEKSEKDRLKMDYRAKLALTEQNYNRQIEREKKKLKENATAVLADKQRKLDKLKTIINQDPSDTESLSSISSDVRPYYTRGGNLVQHSRAATTSNIVSAKSEPDLTNNPRSSRTPGPPTAPKPFYHTRAQTTSVASPRNPTRSRSPPPVRPKPAISTRCHRRSKSSHELWLEHIPRGTVDAATLLQPKMKKRRSVTRLTEKDTQKASKYVLQHQGLDSDGDLATKFVKGDILPTIGGGSSVIFNEVETLKLKSPGDKLSHGYQPKPEDFEGEWTDTEDRCKTAVEHHGHLRRITPMQRSSRV